MAKTYVTSGQTYSGPVPGGDQLIVESGGLASGTDVSGEEDVLNDGSSISPVIEDRGLLVSQVKDAADPMSAPANVNDAIVLAGGSFDLGGSSVGASVYGSEVAETTNDPANGAAFAFSDQDVVNPGGVMTFGSGSVGLEDVINGGLADFTNANSYCIDVTFEGAGGVLAFSTLSNDHGNISGFAASDAVTIQGIPAQGAVLSVTGDEVTVSNGSTSFTVEIDGASSDDLQLGTVDNQLAIEVVCFLAGTAIATPTAPRAIEALSAGDLVLTADGETHPVRWLGRQTVVTRFADPARVAPIRIRAGALSEALPIRDLLVSADHALMVDGVFVQAGALVNGLSITREECHMPARFTYFHVELERHALILAEGVPAETFIDNVDRLAFDDWDEHAALADTATLAEMPHPRAKAARQVPAALRARLLALASGASVEAA